MKLITKEIEKKFAKVGRQEGIENPIVVAKFFNPTGIGTWYATEYYPEEKLFYGYVKLFESEWGYFSLEELETFKGRFGMGIERDIYFTEKPIKEIINK